MTTTPPAGDLPHTELPTRSRSGPTPVIGLGVIGTFPTFFQAFEPD